QQDHPGHRAPAVHRGRRARDPGPRARPDHRTRLACRTHAAQRRLCAHVGTATKRRRHIIAPTMETKWLEDFVSLAETRSYSRSAQLRHVTQPAFSRRIQSLEAWAGTDLVDRSSYP